jgi:hypothetical protein
MLELTSVPFAVGSDCKSRIAADHEGNAGGFRLGQNLASRLQFPLVSIGKVRIAAIRRLSEIDIIYDQT